MRVAKEIFLKVLNSLPAEDQLKIRVFWQWACCHEFNVYEYTASEMQALGASSTVAACTKGCNFYFRYELFDDAPDEILEAIIAHELAHSFNGLEQAVDVALYGTSASSGK